MLFVISLALVLIYYKYKSIVTELIFLHNHTAWSQKLFFLVVC